jgi:hypothetical protein
LDEDLSGCTRIAAHRFHGLGADHTDTDGGGGAAYGPLETVGDITCNFCNDWIHDSGSVGGYRLP